MYILLLNLYNGNDRYIWKIDTVLISKQQTAFQYENKICPAVTTEKNRKYSQYIIAKSVVFSTSSSVRSRAEAETSLSSRAFIDSLFESPLDSGFPTAPSVAAAGSTNRSSPFSVEVDTADERFEEPFWFVLGPWYLAELPRARGDVGPRLNPGWKKKVFSA